MKSLLRRLAQRLAPPPLQPPVYVGDHTLLARTIHNNWIYLDSRDTSLTPSIAFNGDWEPHVAKAFLAALKPGMRVADVGCNCGFYTLLAARAVGEEGGVVGIDANPRMVELTRRSINANAMSFRAQALHGAVTEIEGLVELGVPEDLMGSGSLLARAGEHAMSVTTHKVQGKPLAGYLTEPRLDLLKIDAEGAEPLILKGAAPLLEANRDIVVFMEFAPIMQQHFEGPADTLARLRGQGFAVYEIAADASLTPRTDGELLERTWTELVLKRR